MFLLRMILHYLHMRARRRTMSILNRGQPTLGLGLTPRLMHRLVQAAKVQGPLSEAPHAHDLFLSQLLPLIRMICQKSYRSRFSLGNPHHPLLQMSPLVSITSAMRQCHRRQASLIFLPLMHPHHAAPTPCSPLPKQSTRHFSPGKTSICA